MNIRQRRYHRQVAEDVVALTGSSIGRAVGIIENQKILKAVLRLEVEMSSGRPRKRMVAAIKRRLAELARLKLPTCTRCGCTDVHGCPGGCLWVAPNLCSQCA